MRTFQDSKKNIWRISLPIGTVLRVRDQSAGRFNLLEPKSLVPNTGPLDWPDATLATIVQFDIVLFWELLWYLISPQAKKANIDAEEFGEVMTAACCRAALEAFTAEWLDFFQDLNRPDLLAIVGRSLKIRQQIQATIEKQLPTEQEIDQPMLDSLSQRLTSTFGDWEASWKKTPGDIPGDN